MCTYINHSKPAHPARYFHTFSYFLGPPWCCSPRISIPNSPPWSLALTGRREIGTRVSPKAWLPRRSALQGARVNPSFGLGERGRMRARGFLFARLVFGRLVASRRYRVTVQHIGHVSGDLRKYSTSHTYCTKHVLRSEKGTQRSFLTACFFWRRSSFSQPELRDQGEILQLFPPKAHSSLYHVNT